MDDVISSGLWDEAGLGARCVYRASGWVEANNANFSNRRLNMLGSASAYKARWGKTEGRGLATLLC